MNNINNKTSPDQMRHFIKNMKTHKITEKYVNESKTLDMRDMLKITRKLNEGDVANKETVFDQPQEEEKFLNNFNDVNINVKFRDLKVFDNYVLWGGTIDGIIQFKYKVTPNEVDSGVTFNYLDGFTPDNPDAEDIIARVEGYYDTFYKYWQNNVIQK